MSGRPEQGAQAPGELGDAFDHELDDELAPGLETGLDVVGIGSMVVDRMHRAARLLGGDAKAMLREAAPGQSVERHVGGVVLNHLGWTAALGLRCGIFGRQGDDEDGRFLRAAMDRAGIERDLLLTDEVSSLAEIFVDDAGRRAIYMAPGATAKTTADQIRAHHAPFIARAQRLTTEVSQLPLGAALEGLCIARELGIPTLVDLDVPPRDAVGVLGTQSELHAVLSAADILKTSKSAAQELVRADARDALGLARALRERFGNTAVVVTDGERGCAISAPGFDGEVAAARVRPVDTTGAGDAFLGGLLVGLRLGLDWPVVGTLANAAGAACAEQLGAFPDDAAAARARVHQHFAALCDEEIVWPESSSPAVSAADAANGGSAFREGEAPSALAVLDAARDALQALRARARAEDFDRAAAILRACTRRGGRVHIFGVGKPGHVARYAAALFSSTGTPAVALDPLEVVHGSAGQVQPGDVAIAISRSGRTGELIEALVLLAARGAQLIAVVGDPTSPLAKAADCVLDAAVAREGGPLDLAPRSSIAAEVAVLAALAAELQARVGQTRAEYAELHPAGTLGRRARD